MRTFSSRSSCLLIPCWASLMNEFSFACSLSVQVAVPREIAERCECGAASGNEVQRDGHLQSRKVRAGERKVRRGARGTSSRPPSRRARTHRDSDGASATCSITACDKTTSNAPPANGSACAVGLQKAEIRDAAFLRQTRTRVLEPRHQVDCRRPRRPLPRTTRACRRRRSRRRAHGRGSARPRRRERQTPWRCGKYSKSA